ncbi:hypothetical protein [Streptomyces sp. NPDC048106]|uniref:hypothetical protein n=1 Tax=Streptomyces sp. NPDC048106 TaxID=3155750 RepID=UPI0034517BD9
MGEGTGGDGPPGHRRAPRGGALAPPCSGTTDVEARLRTALRAYGPDPGGEGRAVAAFRAARASGARPPRTRTRDDWRPAAPRRSLRTVLSLVLACLALGGAATAAIGVSGAHSGRPEPRRTHPAPAATAPAVTAAPATMTPSPTVPGSREATHPARGPRPAARPGTRTSRAETARVRGGATAGNERAKGAAKGNGRGRHPPQERPRPSL